MLLLTWAHGPAQRVKVNAATQTLPERSVRWTTRPLRSVKEKSRMMP
jgi:hypothetical protein